MTNFYNFALKIETSSAKQARQNRFRNLKCCH